MPTTAETTSAFDQALLLIDDWIGPRGVPGAAAVVWHRGAIAAERYAGEARPGVAVDERTIFALASVTKPITAALVLTLVEEGRLSLDEPAARLVTAFAAGPDPAGPDADTTLETLRPHVTVRHLLAHTSGLPEDAGPRHLRYADRADLPAVVDALCRLPLTSPPAAELRYSNAGYAVLARLVEHLTGQPFWDAARDRVLAPLALHDTIARPGPDLAPRLVHMADTTHPGTDLETYNGPYWRDLAIPWGGLFGTPRDLARFAASFLPTGPRLLSPPSVRLMTSDHADGVPGGVESARVRWPVAHWGLGWEVKGTKRRHWTGDLTSPRTFCHFGHAGTLLWADPTRDLALAVFANRTTIHLWPFVPPRWSRLSNAVVAATE